ncbi:GNAT family N-acetyltransferase [Aphanizomenon sp. CS-733/32]|nr:GNAT family N-acetyltransferase [Aphanizomenon sp. CS-733/32]
MTTSRLKIFPCSLEVSQAAVSKDKLQVEKLLGANVPDDWFAADVLDFLPIYAQMLQDNPNQIGWGVWLIILIDNSTLIGDLGFGGKPDEQGTVEMGYEVLSAYRHQGYAFEAVQALVNFAITDPKLKRIISYCPQDNFASQRILEKLGMQQIETLDSPDYLAEPMLKWEMTAAVKPKN